MKRKNSKAVAGSGKLRPSLLALAVSQMLTMPVSNAATINVTTASTNPNSGCTLNEAIITANDDTNTGGCSRSGNLGNTADTIVLPNNAVISFAAGSSSGPGNVSTATPFVGSNITIEGNGSTIERSQATTNLFRLFTVFTKDVDNYQGQLTIKDLTIQNGYLEANGGAIYVLGQLDLENTTISSNTSTQATEGGGAIFVRGSDNSFTSVNSSVTAIDSTISSNTAAQKGGGILAEANTTIVLINSTVSGNSVNSRGGGIWAFDSSVRLSNSTVSGNSTRTRGGGIYARDRSSISLNNSTVSANSANETAGGIFSSRFSSVSLNNSTVSGNSAYNVGGIFAQVRSSVTLRNSTISGNSAAEHSGGLMATGYSSISLNNSTVSGNSAVYGGGIYVSSSSVSLSNSTLSGNSAVSGGGIYALSDGTGSSVALSNSTVAGNSAMSGAGGGIYVGRGSVSLTNSIVANSLNGGDCLISSTSVTITANEHNIIEDGTCGTNALSVDPRLGPLQDNGGRTQTHALLANSPAINAGDNAFCAAQPINRLDQRGFQHVGICDIGSYEYNSPGPPLPPPPPPFEPATIVPPIMLLLDDEES